MKFLKNLALSLLSFLLFLSLSLFGLAFMLNNTLLNPDFVTSELNRLDVASLVQEAIQQEAQPDKGPVPEGMVVFLYTFAELEPMIKEGVSAAIYPIYDYLLGRSQDLNLALIAKNNLLKPAFITSIVDKIDIASLLKMALAQTLAKEEISPEVKPMVEAIFSALSEAITEAEPWIKEQIGNAAQPIANYLLGLEPSFKVVISLDPIKQTLRDNLWEAFQKSPPAEVAALPPAMKEQLFERAYQEFSGKIPATFEVNENLLPTGLKTNVTLALIKAEMALEQSRQYIGYFQLAYKALIGFILLLILGIIFLNREVRGATRKLGATFLTYGVLEYAAIFLTRYFASRELPLFEIPLPLQTWLPQFLDNLLTPLERFSLGLLIGGVVLVIVSIVYRPRQIAS